MILTTARATVRQYARNAGSSSAYSNFDIDTAIASLGNRFLRMTQFLTRVDTLVARSAGTAWVSTAAYIVGDQVALAGRAYQCVLGNTNQTPPNITYWTDLGASAGLLDVSSIATGATDVTSFHPRRLISAYPSTTDGSANSQTGNAIDLVDYDSLLKRINVDRRTGGIRSLAWQNPTTAVLYPIPDIDYDVTLRWWTPLTVWTMGTQGAYSASVQYQPGDIVSNSSHTWQCKATALAQTPAAGIYWNDLGVGSLIAPASVTLNIPDDVLSEILPCGAPAQLQHNEPEHGYAGAAWQKYLEIEASYVGAGSLDGNFSQFESYPAHRSSPHNRWPDVFGKGG